MNNIEALAWRVNWIADIQRKARLLYQHNLAPWATPSSLPPTTQELAFYVESTIQTPLVLPPAKQRLLNPASTTILSLAQLGLVSAKTTCDLASEAALWFAEKYHCLPTSLHFSPLRCMQPQSYFALDERCERIGLYTVEIGCEPTLASDIVRVESKIGGITDLYL